MILLVNGLLLVAVSGLTLVDTYLLTSQGEHGGLLPVARRVAPPILLIGLVLVAFSLVLSLRHRGTPSEPEGLDRGPPYP